MPVPGDAPAARRTSPLQNAAGGGRRRSREWRRSQTARPAAGRRRLAGGIAREAPSPLPEDGMPARKPGAGGAPAFPAAIREERASGLPSRNFCRPDAGTRLPPRRKPRRPALPFPARSRRRGYPLHPRQRLAVHCAHCRPRAPGCGARWEKGSVASPAEQPAQPPPWVQRACRTSQKRILRRLRQKPSPPLAGEPRSVAFPRSRTAPGMAASTPEPGALPHVARRPAASGKPAGTAPSSPHAELPPLRQHGRAEGRHRRRRSLRKRSASPGLPRRRLPEARLRHPRQDLHGHGRSRFGRRGEGIRRLSCAGTLERLFDPCACPSAEAHCSQGQSLLKAPAGDIRCQGPALDARQREIQARPSLTGPTAVQGIASRPDLGRKMHPSEPAR